MRFISRPVVLGCLVILAAGCVGELDGGEEDSEARFAQSGRQSYQVVVLGGGAAGVGAAVSAARLGLRVALVAELSRLGGMISNGVSRTDLGTIGQPVSPSRAHASSGLFEELRRRVAARYAGLGAPFSSGLLYEPDLAAGLIAGLVRDTPGIDLLTGLRLRESDGVVMQGPRVTGIVVESKTQSLLLEAEVFIDATDAGDLLGQAGKKGIDWVVGREYRSATGESLAPALPGTGDELVQAYNFRVTIQRGGVPVPRPADYDANRPRYQQAWAANRGGSCSIAGVTYKQMWIQGCLPNGKMDINLDLVGANHAYPTGSAAVRRQIHDKLQRFALGWVHYLSNERGYRELGLSRDDYDENGHFPPVLYIREARRMVGTYLFRQHDAEGRDGDCRALPPRGDSVAVGDYGMDTHLLKLSNDPGDFPGGAFGWTATRPYQVPFGVLVPKRLEGLLVAHAVSGTHVGYSTLRMEPVRMNLGQAAGTAAALAVLRRVPVRAVPVRAVQLELARQAQGLLYFNDLPSTHPAFAAIQGLAARGAMIGDLRCQVSADQTLARGQLAKLTVVALGLGINTAGGPHFTDVPPSHGFYPFVETLHNAGVIQGYGDGTFGVSQAVTRGALAKIAVRAAGLPASPTGVSHFEGLAASHWASPYAEALYRQKVLKGPAFHPDEPASRGLAAIIVDGVARAVGR